MMKRNLILLFILLSGTYLSGQDRTGTFRDLCCDAENDSLLQVLLTDWDKEAPDDPELAVARFNYYFNRSRREIVQLGPEPESDRYLTITDSTAETVGYMYGRMVYNDSLFNLGIEAIDKGLALYPERLDMHFGKIYVYGEKKDYESFVKEILGVIDVAIENKNEWKWSGGRPLEEPEAFFRSTIQEYIYKLFQLDPPLYIEARKVSEKMLILHPGNPIILTNIGASYFFEDDYETSLKYLLKAEEHSPEFDPIIVSNIAQAYAHLEKYNKAKEYYEKIVEYGTEADKAAAGRVLEQMRSEGLID